MQKKVAIRKGGDVQDQDHIPEENTAVLALVANAAHALREENVIAHVQEVIRDHAQEVGQTQGRDITRTREGIEVTHVPEAVIDLGAAQETIVVHLTEDIDITLSLTLRRTCHATIHPLRRHEHRRHSHEHTGGPSETKPSSDPTNEQSNSANDESQLIKDSEDNGKSLSEETAKSSDIPSNDASKCSPTEDVNSTEKSKTTNSGDTQQIHQSNGL
ncbi:hypothetical protein Tcan_18423 [Toxocara canis]|uniref:Uncharacterized protein n=1 Tax=Toxocara canis TaxID=6265 RepID=A0A0B2VRG8_TOXCA|nr:hypothetical protein Tcan_18423 [Toxocara canis]